MDWVAEDMINHIRTEERKKDWVLEGMINHIRTEERKRMIDEGYIHKDDCPRAREDKKIKELKKANKSLQRKITELTLEIETAKMMR